MGEAAAVLEEGAVVHDDRDAHPVRKGNGGAGDTTDIRLSPQAKGRVERAAGTFQDQLGTELRLAGAATMEEAKAVHQEIVAVIAGVNDFADVKANHLGTFAGALGFDNLLTELEARDFHGLASLTEMLITFNPQLTELPCDVFSDLMSVEIIHLHDNGLEYLLWQAFLGLSSLGTLWLDIGMSPGLPTGHSGYILTRSVDHPLALDTGVPVVSSIVKSSDRATIARTRPGTQ